MKSQSGFTLVETLSAGLVSTVLAGVVLSLMQMSGKEALESLVRQNVAHQSSIVSEQIHRMARQAYFARSTDEAAWTHPSPLPALGGDLSAQTGLIFYAQDSSILGGYRLQTVDGVTSLLEYKNGSWQDFKVGDTPVKLVANQIFSVSQNRRIITFDARLSMTTGGVTYQHANPREVAFCRNSK